MTTDYVLPGPPDIVEGNESNPLYFCFVCDPNIDRAFKSYGQGQQTPQFQISVLNIQPQKPPPTITFVLQNQTHFTNIKREKKKLSSKSSSSTPTIPDAGNNPNLRKLAGRSRLVDITLLPKLRIVKKDFRRRYIEMYNNVMNFHDPELLHRFLNDFCIPSCQFIIETGTDRSPPISHGILDIVRYVTITAMRMPDNVQVLTNARIHVSLDQPGSRIICSVLYKGTVLLELPPEQMKSLFASQTLPSSSSNSSFDTSDDDKRLSTDSDDVSSQSESSSSKLPSQLMSTFKSLQLVPSDDPREVVVEGVFTIHLDDCNRIEKFLLQACQISTNTVDHVK